jgi:hypothetical protein
MESGQRGALGIDAVVEEAGQGLGELTAVFVWWEMRFRQVLETHLKRWSNLTGMLERISRTMSLVRLSARHPSFLDLRFGISLRGED